MSSESILPDLLVSTDWLEEHLSSPQLAIVDIRGYVNSTDVGGGRQTAVYLGAGDEYAAGHIPGSVFVDWTRDIVDLENPVPAQIASPSVCAGDGRRGGSATKPMSWWSITPAVTSRPDSGGRCATTVMTGSRCSMADSTNGKPKADR